MYKKKFENDKFVLNYQYNEQLEKFENILYKQKKLNELEKKILAEACLLIPKCSIHELYEHLIIRVENKLRDYNNTTYSGILFPENIAKEYKYFHNFFREFLKPYLKKDLHKTINFQAIKPNKEWTSLTEEEKKDKIYEILKKFDEHQQKFIKGLKIIKITNNVDIYIAIPPIADIDLKNRLCLNLEIYLKKNLEESLIIYLETLWDKNKLRRLSL